MNTKRQSICILTHAVFFGDATIHGPAHALETLLKQQHSVMLVEHPLSGVFPSRCIVGDQRDILLPPSSVGVLRWIKEISVNLRLLLRYRPDVVIAIDPINAIAMVLLQAVGLLRTCIYYTVDFATVRSQNKVLDILYHAIDRLVAQSATQCWAVSRRILDYRQKQQGIASSSLFVLPNSPVHAKTQRSHTRDRFALVIVSNIHKGVGFEQIFQAFFSLAQVQSSLTLTVIGDGQERPYYERLVKKKKLAHRVHFMGRLSHQEVHAVLSRSGIGLALYTGHDPHRYYSDSMKARDYLACGLPVIISGDVGTAEEIAEYAAGAWVELESKTIASAILSICAQQKVYASYSKQARRLAKERDFTTMARVPLAALHIDL